MNQTETLSGLVALVGAAWLGYTAWANKGANGSTGTPDLSAPWYLNYNVTKPITAPFMSTLPPNATGIQNEYSAPSSGCSGGCNSLFGTTWGSQY